MKNKEKKDICVIGTGRFGQTIVEQLVEMKKDVLAIDSSEKKLVQVSRITHTAIADGADLEGLRSLGVQNFNIIIVATGDNVEIIAALLELGVKHIIAKAKNKRHERVLKQIGVDAIVKPEFEAGIRTALMATNPSFIKYSKLLQEIGDGYALGSTILTDLSWIGKPLKNLDFSKLKVNIVSIKRGPKVYIANGNTVMKKNDLVTVIGKIEDITKAFIMLNDDSSEKIEKILKVKKIRKKYE